MCLVDDGSDQSRKPLSESNQEELLIQSLSHSIAVMACVNRCHSAARARSLRKSVGVESRREHLKVSQLICNKSKGCALPAAIPILGDQSSYIAKLPANNTVTRSVLEGWENESRRQHGRVCGWVEANTCW